MSTLSVSVQGISGIRRALRPLLDPEITKHADSAAKEAAKVYARALRPEVRRVCKPSGEIFIVNHFHSRLPLIRHLERLMSPLSRLAGFRPDMDLNEFIRDAQLDVLEKSRANLFGHSHVLRCNCRPARFPPLAEPYPEVATEF